jgi:hypothetical protein
MTTKNGISPSLKKNTGISPKWKSNLKKWNLNIKKSKFKKMKKLVVVVFAVLANCFAGALAASAVDVSPIYGALALNGIGVVLGNLVPQDALGVGIYTEVWTGEMIKAFRNSAESLGWYTAIRSYDEKAQHNVIHFVELGGDPDVLINNTTYPIPLQALTDADVPIGLDKYQTSVTPITDDELHAISYDKMGSVIERHKEAINEKKYAKALHALAPASDAAFTPVILTTGQDDGTGRRMITRQDIIALKKKYDGMKTPVGGRILVLCNDHVNDLLEQDQKFVAQYHNYTTGKISNLYGFDIYEYTDCPYFNAGAKTKKAFGSIPTAGTDFQASVSFYAQRMMRADGETKAYLSPAASDPESQQNLCNFRHYSICLPLTNKSIGAIVSQAAEEEEA